jgi:hypothetical protein
MKNFLTIISLFVVALCHAQANKTYSTVITDHLNKDGSMKSETIKYDKGTLFFNDTLLKIDFGQPTQQIYSIVPSGAGVYEAADDGQVTRSFYLITTTKTGVKAIMCVILIDAKGKMTDVVIKKTKSTRIDYVLN